MVQSLVSKETTVSKTLAQNDGPHSSKYYGGSSGDYSDQGYGLG
jgi:hypothetical protein